MKRIIFFASITLSMGGALFWNPSLGEEHFQGYPIEGHTYLGGYNPSSRIETDHEVNVFIKISYIYWEPRENGLDLAILSPIEKNDYGEVVPMNASYSSGIKVGGGIHLSQDNWKLITEYTRYKNVSKSQPFYGELKPLWFGDNPLDHQPSEASGLWKTSFNLAHLSLTRSQYSGKRLLITPRIGLQVGWIDQKILPTYYYAELLPEHPKTSVNSSSSWLVGPVGGVETKWLITKNFHLYGLLTSSLNYQRFKLKADIPALSEIDYSDLITENTFSHLTPTMGLNIGFDWECYAVREIWNFSLELGYEAELLWNQNMIRRMLLQINQTIDQKATSLTLHGITFAGRFVF